MRRPKPRLRGVILMPSLPMLISMLSAGASGALAGRGAFGATGAFGGTARTRGRVVSTCSV
jgi:hypothetical protein